MPPKKRTQELALTVPTSFVVPAIYGTASPDVIADVLQIGATMYDVVNKTYMDMTLADIEAKKSAEISRIQECAEQTIRDLNAQLAAAEQERQTLLREQNVRLNQLLETQRTQDHTVHKEELERQLRVHDARYAAAQHELKMAQERCAALMERKTVLENARDADIRRAEEQTRSLLQHTLDEKQRAIERLEREKDRLSGHLEKQTEELHALSDLIRRKPTNVKTKGNEYEAIFREKLIAAYGTGDKFRLEDSARNGVGHAGDYLMNWGDHTVLWEVKNYDKPVPSAEVDKFRRDMKENAHVRVGVMVSRYTPIVGKTSHGDRDIEFMEGKMLVYLSNFEHMSDDALPGLMLLFRLWWESDRNIEEEESKMAMIRHIEKLHAAAVKSRTEWRLHRSRMEDTVRWMAEVVEENESKLQNALNLLNGTATLDVPAGIFRDCAGDEKATQLIQLLLEHVAPVATGEIVLNDLADIVGKRKGLSRDTAKTHIRAVLLDSVIEPPKGKMPARILGLALR